MLMFVNVSEMFEELQEKAKLFRAELEGYAFSNLHHRFVKHVEVFHNLLELNILLVMTSMSVEHKCYHTVNENSHIKRFCTLMQFIWLQSAKVIRVQQFESSARHVLRVLFFGH